MAKKCPYPESHPKRRNCRVFRGLLRGPRTDASGKEPSAIDTPTEGTVVRINDYGLCEVATDGHLRAVFTLDKLSGYAGQPLRDLGLKVGTRVLLRHDANGRCCLSANNQCRRNRFLIPKTSRQRADRIDPRLTLFRRRYVNSAIFPTSRNGLQGILFCLRRLILRCCNAKSAARNAGSTMPTKMPDGTTPQYMSEIAISAKQDPVAYDTTQSLRP